MPVGHIAGSSLGFDRFALVFLARQPDQSLTLLGTPVSLTTFSSITANPPETGLLAFEHFLALIAARGTGNDQISALHLLEGIDNLSSSTLKTVRDLSTSSKEEVRVSAVAILVKSGDTGDFATIERVLGSLSPAGYPVEALSISSEMSSLRKEDRLALFEFLSASACRPIKLGALDGLRNLRSTESIPSLVNVLDDGNIDVQFIAVRALAEITKKDGQYSPGTPEFYANPTFYVQLWKQWWSSNPSGKN